MSGRARATRCRSTASPTTSTEFFSAQPHAAAGRRGPHHRADLEVPGRSQGRAGSAARAAAQRASREVARAVRLERAPHGRSSRPCSSARTTSRCSATSPSSTARTCRPRSSSTTPTPRRSTTRFRPTAADDIGFDVAAIDWEDYMQNVHLPSITAMTRVFPCARAGEGAGRQGAAEAHRRGRHLRPRGHRRRRQPRRAVPVGAVRRLPQGGLAGRVPEPAANVPGVPSGRTPRPRRIHPRVPAPLRGDAVFAAREGRHGRLQRHAAASHVCPRPFERIREHREAGHRTILVTGSIGILASPLAGLFDEVVASTMHQRDGVLTGYLERPPLVDEARAAWLRQYAEDPRNQPRRSRTATATPRRPGLAGIAGKSHCCEPGHQSFARSATKTVENIQLEAWISRTDA